MPAREREWRSAPWAECGIAGAVHATAPDQGVHGYNSPTVKGRWNWSHSANRRGHKQSEEPPADVMRRSSCLTGSGRNRSCRFWLPEILSRCPPCAPVWHNHISPRNGFGAAGKVAYAEEFGRITLIPFTPGKRAFAKIRLSYDISCLPVWPVHLSGKAFPIGSRRALALAEAFATFTCPPNRACEPPLHSQRAPDLVSDRE